VEGSSALAKTRGGRCKTRGTIRPDALVPFAGKRELVSSRGIRTGVDQPRAGVAAAGQWWWVVPGARAGEK
jgi:hypothetical protein